MGKQAPSAPDPYAAAAAQYGYGTKTAEYNKALNATNQVGPTGSTTNAITGYDPQTGAPIYTQTTQLTPQEQALLGGQEAGGLREQQLASQTLGQVPGGSLYNIPGAPQLQTQLDTSNVPGLPSTAATGGIQDQATRAVQAQLNAQLDPQWQQQQEQLQAQLVNSGNGPGTPAYENAMSQFNAQKTAAYTQAAGQAQTTGAQVGQTQFGEAAQANQQQYQQDLQTMISQNQAQGMGLQEAIQAAQGQLSQREGAAQMASGLYGASAPNIPGASGIPTAAAAAPNIMQAMQNAYMGQLGNYNANVGTMNSLIGDASTIAMLAMLG